MHGNDIQFKVTVVRSEMIIRQYVCCLCVTIIANFQSFVLISLLCVRHLHCIILYIWYVINPALRLPDTIKRLTD